MLLARNKNHQKDRKRKNIEKRKETKGRGVIAERKRSNIKIEMRGEEAERRKRKIGMIRNMMAIITKKAEAGRNIKRRKKIKREDLIHVTEITEELTTDPITS